MMINSKVIERKVTISPHNHPCYDQYLTSEFRGKPCIRLFSFISNLYDEESWRMLFFQKKTEKFRKTFDSFFLLYNIEAEFVIITKINPPPQIIEPAFVRNVNVAEYEAMDFPIHYERMPIEFVYSKPHRLDINKHEDFSNLIFDLLG